MITTEPTRTTSPRRRREARRAATLRKTASGWWDIVRRAWKQGEEDNVLFLAGGVAFNVLLALVPFVLLLISGIAILLGRRPDEAVQLVTELLGAFLPNGSTNAEEMLRALVTDVLKTRGTVTTYAAIGFAWFSTRLFGSLRSVLALIFDGTDRGIMVGKLFDFAATFVATLAVVVYIAVSAYLNLARTRGLELIERYGWHVPDSSIVTYLGGRVLGMLIVLGFFYAMYHGLPRRRPSVRTAFTAALTSMVLFEIARNVFAWLVRHYDPSSLYTGSIAAIVAVVFWTYYGSLLFLIGGELAQATELRRVSLRTISERVDTDSNDRPAK